MIGMHQQAKIVRIDELRNDYLYGILDENVYVIELDTDTISNGVPRTGKKPPKMPSMSLPAGPLKDLEKRLETICSHLKIAPGQVSIVQ